MKESEVGKEAKEKDADTPIVMSHSNMVRI